MDRTSGSVAEGDQSIGTLLRGCQISAAVLKISFMCSKRKIYHETRSGTYRSNGHEDLQKWAE